MFTSRQVSLSSINTDTIYTGVFDPNNILIHVSQNLVNFVTSSLTWLIILPLFSSGGGREGGQAREASEGWGISDASWVIRRIADTVDVVNRLREEL